MKGKKQKVLITRVVSIILIALLLLGIVIPALSGCSSRVSPNDLLPEEVSSGNKSSDEPAVRFDDQGFKIRSVITPQTASTLDPMVFEVYVDKNGNGSGLCGYKDNTYDVIISGNKLYVQVDSGTVAHISDLTGHLTSTNTNTSSLTNPTAAGFSVYNGSVVSYSYSDRLMTINGSYQQTEELQTVTPVAQGNDMTLSGFISYILEYEGSIYTPDSPDEGSVGVDQYKESFWNESWIGVQIHDKIYSLGDYCNPSTYFEDTVPDGIIPSYSYKQDQKIEFIHIKYTSSDGISAFMTADGYVQYIATTSYFKFLEIEYGMPLDNLKELLGIGLKKDQLLTFQPMVEGLTAVSGKSNSYILTYDDFTIVIYVDRKTNKVAGMAMSIYIDFLEG